MKNEVKKVIIVILMVFLTLCIYGFQGYRQGANLITNKSPESGKIAVGEKHSTGFFFDDISAERIYSVRHSFFTDDIPEQVFLQVTLEAEYEKGTLYRMQCVFAEGFLK